MQMLATILALSCLLLNAEARNVDGGRDRCARNSRSWISCSHATADSLVPHPDDCGLFYYCAHPGSPPVCRECPAGLHFNPELHVCDWPGQAGCYAPTTETTTEVATETTPDLCELDSCGFSSCVSCAEAEPLSLIAHPENCDLYYLCVHPALAPLCFHCPFDWHFNPSEQVCEPQDEAGCVALPTELATDASEVPTDAPTEVPTDAPTEVPTDAPTEVPSNAPTEVPTDAPTEVPTDAPTEVPTDAPTEVPTDAPTDALTGAPTATPYSNWA